MPKSLSHVVVMTDDLDGILRFFREVANVSSVTEYQTVAEDVSSLFDWPSDVASTRGAFVGEGPGGIDLLEIPAALRDEVQPGVRLLAIANRDVEAAGAAAAVAGYATRGPFTTTAATGRPMSLVEVVAGGIAFELVQFS